MPPYEKSLLVNLIGHAAGTMVFGLFLVLFLRDRVGPRLRGSWLTVVAATLAIVWNLGSLAALLLRNRHDHEGSLIETISFSALSILPAVLLHISLRESLASLRVAGYVLSGTAVVLHVSELWIENTAIHSSGLLLITIGFGILTVASAVIAAVRGGTVPGSRLVGSMSLVLFSTSFSHFGVHDGHAWSNELFFHHAGLPLAIFVLLQDYRFLLLDAFLRFLASVVLAGCFATLAFRIPLRGGDDSPLQHGLTLGAAAVILLAFAMVHQWLQGWLTRTVFRRPDVAAASQRLRMEGPASEVDYLNWCVIQLGQYLNAERAEAADSSDPCGNPSPHPAADHVHGAEAQPDWVEAVVPLQGPPGSRPLLYLGRRRGGLRYLSEDYRFLAQMAAIVSERLADFRTLETQKLLSGAELKALQSQINPHFLFNALNTIYGSIPREFPQARKMVHNLSDIFRYLLLEETAAVPLSREIEIVRAYLEIEQLRFPDRLRVSFQIEPDAASCRIPILTLQPLVENAIKHAIAVNPAGGELIIAAGRIQPNTVELRVSDTGRGEGTGPGPGAEVGLANVRRRIELHFGDGAALETDFHPAGSTIRIRFPSAQPQRNIPQDSISVEKCL